MNFFDKIKTYYKEHKREVIKISKIVLLSLCLLAMLFSCAVDSFAAELSSPSPLADDVSGTALPDDYNIIPVGTYTIRYNELDFLTYPLSPGEYPFRCVCNLGVVQATASNSVSFVSSLETVSVAYVSSDEFGFVDPNGDFGYLYSSSYYGWNTFLNLYLPFESNVNLSYAPVNFTPILTVSSEQNVGYEFGAFFHNNFVLVNSAPSVECPTLQELLADYPDADMSTLLAEIKPNWFNANNQEYLNAGFEAGYTAGSNDTAEQLEDTFLGDVVGGILDAIDQLVLYSNGDVTITMLTAVRSVFAALFVMWILKLIAGG